MEKSGIKSAVWEVLKTALVYTAFCMLAMALLAVIVKATAPKEIVVTVSCWALKIIGCFVFSLLFIKPPRALFKGLAAGVLCVILAMFAFAAIGGGFQVSIFFLLEIPVCAVAGGAGALLSAKLRKVA